MKKELLIAMTLLFTTPIVKAQDKDEKVKTVIISDDNATNYYYEGVVPVEGVSKEEMFKRAKAWVLTKLKTDDNNVQFDEANLSIVNNATIIIDETVKGLMQYPSALANFKVILNFKNGKYKFRLDNIIVREGSVMYNMPAAPYGPKMVNRKKYNKVLMDKINVAFTNLASDLENTIKGTATKKDNW